MATLRSYSDELLLMLHLGNVEVYQDKKDPDVISITTEKKVHR